jgi:hypothetical protein
MCLMGIILYPLSHSDKTRIYWSHRFSPTTGVEILSWHGLLYLQHTSDANPPQAKDILWGRAHQMDRRPILGFWFGSGDDYVYKFGETRSVFAGGQHIVGVIAPFWGLTALFLVVPAAALFRPTPCRRLERRRPTGMSVNCGYGLRATPDCCPECGRNCETKRFSSE